MRIRKKMVAIISVMLILVTTISYSALNVFADTENTNKGRESGKTETGTEKTVRKPEVSASSYIVMSGSTSEKVLTKHADRKMQPGKITMLMTAMVVIDNMYNDEELSNIVDIDEELASCGSTYKLGESITVGDLLMAMLVGGDEQSAEALASYSASSREVFVNEMNSKSMELGIMDTQFMNPDGSYEITQYSTASDLAVITQAAFRYQKIKDALGLSSKKISVIRNKEIREIEIVSTNPLLAGKADQKYKYIKGGILGNLKEPSDSEQFAAVSVKDDMQLIVILMDSDKEKAAFDAKDLFEYGDSKVTKNTIVKKNKLEGYARVRGGAVTRVAAYTETKGFAYVPPEGSDSLIQTQVVMLDGLEAPLKAGDKAGEFRIYVADELKGTVDLVIKRDVPEGWPPSEIYISNTATVIISVILALLILLFIRIQSVKRRRARRREAMRRQKIRELARMQMEIDEDRRRRNWNGTGYEPMPPRTSDIRREAISEALGREERGGQ